MNDVDWQDVVDAAHGALALQSARDYGLLEGGPEVNVDRCEKALKAGKAHGFEPAADSIERYMRSVGGSTL